MTTIVDVPQSESLTERSWLRARLSEDMRKITSAASRLRIHRKKKEGKRQQQFREINNQEEQTAPAVHAENETEKAPRLQTIPNGTQTLSAGSVSTGKVAPRSSERRWSLSDLLSCLGSYVQKHCTHLHTVPSATDIAMWVRFADRALQLNGWTVNSFLLESHVVFTYMLLSRAFQHFRVSSLVDVKELVLMCLYISYTYNANEISYPLRPFLVKQDRASFWDKCTTLSLAASSCMLRINRDRVFYEQLLASLKAVNTTATE